MFSDISRLIGITRVLFRLEAGSRALMFDEDYKKRAGRVNTTTVFDKFVRAVRAAVTETN